MARERSKGSSKLTLEPGNQALPLPSCVILSLHLFGPLFSYHTVEATILHNVDDAMSKCFINDKM